MYLPNSPIDAITDADAVLSAMSASATSQSGAAPSPIDTSFLAALQYTAANLPSEALFPGMFSSETGLSAAPLPLTPLASDSLASGDDSAAFLDLTSALSAPATSANSSLDSLFDVDFLQPTSTLTALSSTTADSSTLTSVSTPVTCDVTSSSSPDCFGESPSPFRPEAGLPLASPVTFAAASAASCCTDNFTAPVPSPPSDGFSHSLAGATAAATLPFSPYLITPPPTPLQPAPQPSLHPSHPTPAYTPFHSIVPAQPSPPPSSRAPQPTTLPRRYKVIQPSKFCHVCVRSGELVDLAPCANVASGVCRKAICRKCFDKHGHGGDWGIAVANKDLLAAERAAVEASGAPAGPLGPEAWTCLHCRNLCPQSAQCKIYARTNRRRHLLLKERKAQKVACCNPLQISGVHKMGTRNGPNHQALPSRTHAYMSTAGVNYVSLQNYSQGLPMQQQQGHFLQHGRRHGGMQ